MRGVNEWQFCGTMAADHTLVETCPRKAFATGTGASTRLRRGLLANAIKPNDGRQRRAHLKPLVLAMPERIAAIDQNL